MTEPPPVRGTLTPDRSLADLTWLRVGGPADWFFQPLDEADLRAFLGSLDPAVPVFPMGVGSNLIVRDGGLRAVVIRLGRGFNGISCAGDRVVAGAWGAGCPCGAQGGGSGPRSDLSADDSGQHRRRGADETPGATGLTSAIHLVEVRVVTASGEVETVPAADLNLRYRQSNLPDGAVIVQATFRAATGEPAALEARMAEQIARREASEPTKERSAGSTFRNPAGFSSPGRADDRHQLKAWKVIDEAGMRGARRGGAQMSEMHSDFLINAAGQVPPIWRNWAKRCEKGFSITAV